MQLRTLFIISIMLPWIPSSAANDAYVEARKPEVKYLSEVTYSVNKQVKEMHNCSELGGKVQLFFFFLLQQHFVNFPDYDILQDTDTDPAVAPKASGKVYFNSFNNCLKADYATLAEVFFHIFVNATKAHIM